MSDPLFQPPPVKKETESNRPSCLTGVFLAIFIGGLWTWFVGIGIWIIFGPVIALIGLFYWLPRQRIHSEAKIKWPFLIAGGLFLLLCLASPWIWNLIWTLLVVVPLAIFWYYGKERFRIFALGFLWGVVISILLAPVICGSVAIIDKLNRGS